MGMSSPPLPRLLTGAQTLIQNTRNHTFKKKKMKERRLVIVAAGISSYRVLRERSIKTVTLQQVENSSIEKGRKEKQGTMGGLVFT